MEEEAPEPDEGAAEIRPEPGKPRRALVKIAAAVIAVAIIASVSYFAFFSSAPASPQPTAFFIARQDQMMSSFDASGSVGGTGHPSIQSYAWNFGDGATGTGVATTHTYQTPGRYTVTLTVSDGASTGTAQRYVSAASTTGDILYDRFFTASCPYADFWP